MTSKIQENIITSWKPEGGLLSLPGISVGSTRAASELLRRNNNDNHIFWADRGFVNHISHALLASYDLGATDTHLSAIYEREKGTQRQRPEVDEKVVTDLSDESNWDKYLDSKSHYTDFLVFFQKESAELGWKEQLRKRVFSRTDSADKFLSRIFAVLYHPVIHIGYGLEFGLPGLVAEGLAQAAVGQNYSLLFLLSAESAALKESGPGKSLRALAEEINKDKKIKNMMSGDEKEIFKAFSMVEDIVSYAKQIRVSTDEIDEKMLESINFSALIFGGAVRKDKQIKLDFFLMHGFTTSIFLPTFLAQDWISLEDKARFLEWKMRYDLFWYINVGSPEIHIDEIKDYVPRVPLADDANPWTGIINRGLHYQDDGHTIKAIRALAHGEKISAKYHDACELMDLPVAGDMWLKIAAMCIDSVEESEKGVFPWIRGAGCDARWEAVGPRKRYSTLIV